MPRLFISYAHQDLTYAKTVRDELLLCGLEPWMDIHDVPTGTYFMDEIDAALRTSAAVVGLLSPAASKSINVRNEWHWALDAKRPLILMQIQTCDPVEISHRFVGLQRLDYQNERRRRFDGLKRAISAASATTSKSDHISIQTSKSETILDFTVHSNQYGRSQDNRTKMLQRIHDVWIKGLLHIAITEQTRFNLDYAVAPDKVIRTVDYSDCHVPGNFDFTAVFRYLGGDVLILGAPGSGKTILLLQLAEKMLEIASRDARSPIPIVLNLSSWAKKRESIEKWISNEGAATYRLKRQTIRRWLDDDAALLLLDGLDEVAEDYRDACVDALNRFRTRYKNIGICVTSRMEEYEFLIARLDLRAAIVIQQLNEEQINTVIARPNLTAVNFLMDREPWLRPMASTPFMLNTLSYAYANKTRPELFLAHCDDPEAARRSHLLNSYIKRRFVETRELRRMSARSLHQFLSILAIRMSERGQSIFHIESLQLDWLSRRSMRIVYCFVFRLLVGFLFCAFLAAYYVAQEFG